MYLFYLELPWQASIVLFSFSPFRRNFFCDDQASQVSQSAERDKTIQKQQRIWEDGDGRSIKCCHWKIHQADDEIRRDLYDIPYLNIIHSLYMYFCAVCCVLCCCAVLYPLLPSLDPIRSGIWNVLPSQLEHMSPSRRGVLDVFHVPRNLRINIYPDIGLWNLKFLDLGPWIDLNFPLPSSLPPVWFDLKNWSITGLSHQASKHQAEQWDIIANSKQYHIIIALFTLTASLCNLSLLHHLQYQEQRVWRNYLDTVRSRSSSYGYNVWQLQCIIMFRLFSSYQLHQSDQ